MSINYTSLLHELQTDPLGLGYSTLAGQDSTIAALLNSLTGTGTGQVAADAVKRDLFLLGIAPAYLTLPSLSAGIQAKWDRILTVIAAADMIDVSSAAVQSLLASAVADNVMTTEVTNQFPPTRVGSRAEVLFGVGTVIQASDIAKAEGRPG